MPDINRRKFIKFIGQGAVAAGVGIGLSGKVRAAEGPQGPPPGEQSSKQTPQKVWDDLWESDRWEVYYPGKYVGEDEKIMKAFHEELDKINKRGEINVKDLVSGKLNNVPGVVKRVDRGLTGLHNEEAGTKITAEKMKNAAEEYASGWVAMPLEKRGIGFWCPACAYAR
jgi:hypothetical protein